MINSKELQYKILQKEIRGISPKLSTYKRMEEEILKLAKELGYKKLKKITKPNWDNNVPVLHHKHKVKVDTDSRTRGAVFDPKIKIGRMNSQSQ